MKPVQLGTTLLFALALVPGGAHLLALPNKMDLDRDTYLAVQQIYQGWDHLGMIFMAALVAGILLTAMSRRRRSPFMLALAGTALLGVSLTLFFTWTLPVNIATHDWTIAPENWMELRKQWEYSHAGNAALVFAALCCITSSCLSWEDAR